MGDNVVSLLDRIINVFSDELVKQSFEKSAPVLLLDENKVNPVYGESPVEVGDIVYMNYSDDEGSPRGGSYSELEVIEVHTEKGIFEARDYNKHNLPYYPRYEFYRFAMEDMMRIPYGTYNEEDASIYKYKAFTYREKLAAENKFWRGKPKSGDIFYGKYYSAHDDTYGTVTTTYKVLGVTEEAFSAAPIYKDSVSEGDTAIFDINTLLEIPRKNKYGLPEQLFTTQDNAHTAYLHKEVLKRQKEDE